MLHVITDQDRVFGFEQQVFEGEQVYSLKHVASSVASLVPSQEKIVLVTACGSELRHVLNYFSHLPHSKAKVQTWRGELANFIVDNLRD